MHVRCFAVSFFLAVLGATTVQSQSSDVKHDERTPTIEDALQRHHVQLTRPALVDALRNADPEVRSLAAAKLAQDKAAETVPAILEALTSETVERTRVNIAFALAQLGEAKGFSGLQNACRDDRLPPFLRIDAARYMVYFLERDDEICRQALLEILQSQPNPDSLMGAASLLLLFHSLSEQESQTIFQVAFRALAAPEPSQRIAASITLGEIGNPSAIPYLQRAIAKEQDKNIRSQMQADLQRLLQKREQ